MRKRFIWIRVFLRSIFRDLKGFFKRKATEAEPLPPDTPLPEIIEKMLIKNGCTINKAGVEEVAGYFVSTILEMIQENKFYLEKVQRDIEKERNLWR